MSYRITRYPTGKKYSKKLSKGVVDIEIKKALEVTYLNVL